VRLEYVHSASELSGLHYATGDFARGFPMYVLGLTDLDVEVESISRIHYGHCRSRLSAPISMLCCSKVADSPEEVADV
jgi:hypothetical protein